MSDHVVSLSAFIQRLSQYRLCDVQPENPAEFGARVYEMMGLALIGKQGGEEKAESVEQSTPSEEGATSEVPSEVVEASEVIAERDPWQS